MKRILIDVDTQFDFVDPNGALYVEAEAGVREAIGSALAAAADEGVPILGSVDSHAWDAWEFAENGGPFPAHCVKGRAGWLRVHDATPSRTRFVPMQVADECVRNLVGELRAGDGVREQDARALADEALSGVGIFFEKEVYSLFSNPAAERVIAALVEGMGGKDQVVFDVLGYCTGGYCVDAAVKGLLERGYQVRVLGGATAAIGGAQGQAKSKDELTALGATWLESAGEAA